MQHILDFKNSQPARLISNLDSLLLSHHSLLSAVGSRVIAKLRRQDTELATAGAAIELLVLDSRVRDERRLDHVVNSALAGLVVCGETPAVSLAILSDDDVVIGAGRDLDSLALDGGDFGRDGENARLLALVFDGSVFGERGEEVFAETALVAVKATPDQAFAVFGGADRVVATAFDGDNSLALEALDDLRLEDDGVVLASVVENTGFAEVVQTPGVDVAVLGNGKAVVAAGLDRCDGLLALGEAELTRH
jgi:hypothetical protein